MKLKTEHKIDVVFYLGAMGFSAWHGIYDRWDAALWWLVLVWFVAWLNWTRSQ